MTQRWTPLGEGSLCVSVLAKQQVPATYVIFRGFTNEGIPAVMCRCSSPCATDPFNPD